LGFLQSSTNAAHLFGQSILSLFVQLFFERNAPFESQLGLELPLLLLLP
jgi:hypothetical protein